MMKKKQRSALQSKLPSPTRGEGSFLSSRLTSITRFLLLIALAICFGSASQSTAADRPNIVFIIADDQCYDTIGALGLTDIDTPNLDRLAKRGATFTHAYNMGSFSPAVCVASRAMLNTGRSLWQARRVFDKMDAEREAGRLWAQLLAAQGYATYMTGKWHLKADATKVFQTTRHIRAGMPQDRPTSYNRPRTGEPDVWSPSDPDQGGYWTGGKHWSEVVADDAVDFVAQARESDKPFFMYLAFNAPHDPRQSPAEYVSRYPLSRIVLPKSFQPDYPYQNEIGCGPSLRDEKLAPFPRTEHAVKVHRQEYYAIITHLDAQVGRILDALDRSGKADNTWIIYTADHGLAVGRHGLFGKQNMYDHSLRVPFLIAGPGVTSGSKPSAPIYLQDAMATTLELAGVARPEHVYFRSVLPHLRGDKQAKVRDTIFGAYLSLQRAVIHDGWKLIVYPKADVVRLYHLSDDPDELHDLAGDPKQTERKRDLAKRLQGEQRQLEDPLDLAAQLSKL